MKRILLTGATGFVGGFFLRNYSDFYKIKIFSFLNDNFQDLNLNNIDVVIHCSALVHQMNGASKDQYYDVNVNQTAQLAKKAKNSGVKHFIFLSTVKVYGEESDIGYKENSPTNPTDYYSASKIEAEDYLRSIENDKFEIAVVRSPLIYGYGVKANFLSLINLIKRISILPLKNTNNKRSIVFVGNVCFILDQIICLKKSGIFIATDDNPLSTTELVELISKCLDKKMFLVNIIFFETLLKIIKPSYYKRLFGSLFFDNSLTMKELNLSSNKYSTEHGIKTIIKSNI
tara:strand:+ start:3248 stop:4108 length:861 start_codon:yes stop_codon:yes gene_type:complete